MNNPKSKMAMKNGTSDFEGGLIDVRRHGAKGDGLTDDTLAIQKAIDAAGKLRGGVWFHPGIYRTSQLKLHSGVALVATPTWGLHHQAGTELHLADERVSCLLDLNGTLAVRVRGLTLDGKSLGQEITGIDLNGLNRPKGGEDTPFLEDCCVRNFTGCGVKLMNCWEFVIRNSLIGFNGGHGLMFSQWDGFLFENMFSANKGYGIAAMRECASHTIHGNRIEWNDLGGIFIEGGSGFQIAGNYIDRSGGPGLRILNSMSIGAGFTVTGNMFGRSGVHAEESDHCCSHVLLDDVTGIVLANNTFKATFAMDGVTSGRVIPAFGVICKDLRCSIIKDNILNLGATKSIFEDLGGHCAATIIKDNVGCLFTA